MRREMRIHCDAKCDSAGFRIRQHGAAQNDRTRCHHSGCSGFFETCASYRNWPAARGRAKKSPPGPGWPGGRKVAGTGTEQTQFHSGNREVVSDCNAECDALSPYRIDVLTRAVILVAGMDLAEAERAAVLARVIADLTVPTTRIPE